MKYIGVLHIFTSCVFLGNALRKSWFVTVQPPSSCQVLVDSKSHGVQILHWVGAMRRGKKLKQRWRHVHPICFVQRSNMSVIFFVITNKNDRKKTQPTVQNPSTTLQQKRLKKVGHNLSRKPWLHWSMASRTVLDRMWWRQHRLMCLRTRSRPHLFVFLGGLLQEAKKQKQQAAGCTFLWLKKTSKHR